jgi:hypothetical protein
VDLCSGDVMFPVRYELCFYSLFHSHCHENLKSYKAEYARKAKIKGRCNVNAEHQNTNLIFRATTGRLAYLVKFPNCNDIRI